MRGKLLGIAISLLVLLACGLLAGTRLETPLSVAMLPVAWLLMLVLSVLKLVNVYRQRHDEHRRARAIWSGRIEPL